jgi:hypothetical protein
MIAIIALEDLKSNTTLYLSYGEDYFNNLDIKPLTLNRVGINQYLRSTNVLTKLPFWEVSPDGLEYFYVEQAQICSRKVKKKPSKSEAIEAWSNKNRVEYLFHYHPEEMQKKLGSPRFKSLKKVIDKKS